MTGSNIDFDEAFAALTGIARGGAYPWQRRLHERLLAGDWPDTLDLPTGLGKTAVMAIWLIALARGAPVPRRLVYVVNRRTIVDQATAYAERMLGLLYWSAHRDKKPWATTQAIDALGLSDEPQLEAAQAAAVAELRERLAALSGDPDAAPLAISTLRGQLADNQQWLRDPVRPTIIVGTVDMIGSRLLFNAYRSSWKQRSLQAGLIGCDALIVHDEAHLTEPFQRLLEWVQDRHADERKRFDVQRRLLRVLKMSATANDDDDANPQGRGVQALSADDRNDPRVQQRIHASKRLVLHRTERKDHVKRLAELAAQHESKNQRVIIFVQKPADADKVVKQLTGKPHGVHSDRVGMLTGTIRGFERDELVEHPVLQSLTDEHDKKQTYYLVSTSAGEVGADFDADHLVCDATSLDSLIQRLGRVNRRGGDGREARIDLVWDAKAASKVKEGTHDASVTNTVELLRERGREAEGGCDVSPAALRKWVDRLDGEVRKTACSPSPAWIKPHDAVLDAWSLTSIRADWPLVHDVTPYLHGVADDDRPTTEVAWRAEMDELGIREVRRHGFEEEFDAWFATHGIRQHEILRTTDISDLVRLLERVRDELEQEKGEGPPSSYERGVFATRRAKAWSLQPLLGLRDRRAIEEAVRGATVVLPTSFGGLNRSGILDPTASPEEKSGELDVADWSKYASDAPRSRFLLTRDDEGETWRVRRLGDREESADRVEAIDEPSAAEPTDLNEARRTAGRAAEAEAERAKKEKDKPTMREAQRVDLDFDENGDVRALLLTFGRRQTPRSKGQPVLLDKHAEEVANRMKRFAAALKFDAAWHEAYAIAADLHDRGKGRDIWQQAVGNGDNSEPWAKPGRKPMNGRMLAGYRHEFGSMVDAVHDARFEVIEDDLQDLALHLIAMHHGRGRPHFAQAAVRHPSNGVDQLDPRLEPVAIARRFDRLQRHYGHWGLAWLEALFMSADIAASATTHDLEAN